MPPQGTGSVVAENSRLLTLRASLFILYDKSIRFDALTLLE